METSLHRDLKTVYADEDARFEVPFGRYRIDVVNGCELVEIQHGSLSAIRDKIRELLDGEHAVTVVKPIIHRKHLIKLDSKGGEVVDTRLSPKRGKIADLFDELIHFTRAFPHPQLTLEVPIINVEERRYPGHGRRRRRRESDYQVEDKRLVEILETHRFRTAADLRKLISGKLPSEFDTAELARAMDEPRDVAQRAAYCFREMGAARQVGKRGNAILYRFNRKGR
ncbi:MAG: hypothetical protein PVH19_09480 [Planctomycetia bacterium]|jgi:hypothetical protein